MIMPFILQKFLKVTSLKNSEFVAIKKRLNINNNNIELDLLKHYTTLFAIQHLMDGGADSRFIRSCASFSNMPSNFKQLFSNLYIGENKLLLDNDNDQVDVNSKIK